MITTHGYSQSTAGLKALDIPQKFVLPNGDQIIKEEDKTLPGNIWEVYSDRTYNKTAIKAGSGTPYKVLQYLEKFYVVETKKKYLHLVKDHEISSDGIFSSQAEDYGWIPSEYLLLWKHCLVDSDKRNKRVFMFKSSATEIYFESIKDEQNMSPGYFQIYYVYKEEKNRSLLGKSIRLYGEYSELDNSLIGWVNNDIFKSFGSNSFAEPGLNIGHKGGSIEEQSISYPIFFDKRNIKKIDIDKISESSTLWYSDYQDQMKPQIFRFPITNVKGSVASVRVYYPEKQFVNGVFNSELEEINGFYNGYCNVYDEISNISFRTVLLLSKTEFAKLLDEIEVIKSSIVMSQNDSLTVAAKIRNSFQFDSFITDTEILSYSIISILNGKYGHFAFNAKEQISIREVLATSAKSNSCFTQFDNYIQELGSIYTNVSTDYFFTSNGIQYYWVPCINLR